MGRNGRMGKNEINQRTKIRLVEAFAGIGSQVQALKNIGIEVETIGIFEVDAFAIKSYEAIHGKVNNFGDISKDVEIPNFDLFTYSFPCQDISNAGLKRGLEKGSGTRSSLLWECEKLIKKNRPPFLLMENVKALVNKRNKPFFIKWLEVLESYGYENHWEILNSKDFGIPQNRERVFCVSFLKENDFKFPKKQEQKNKLVDFLEKDVDERFYLTDDQVKKIRFSSFHQERDRIGNGEIANALCARDYKGAQYVIVASRGRYDENGNIHQNLEPNKNGLANTLTTVSKDNYLLIKNATKKGYLVAEPGDGIDYSNLNSKTRRGRVQKGMVHTLTTIDYECVLEEDIRIRKLTPKEYWRLMGFNDEQFHKAEKVNSNTQLYKQAGNSIVVNVLEAIFKEMFISKGVK